MLRVRPAMIEGLMPRRFAILWVAVSLFIALPARGASHWTRLASPNFELYTTGGEKRGRETIRYFEQVRDFFLLASPLEGTRESPLRIVEFEDSADFNRFRPNEAAIAFFLAGPEREYIVMSDAAVKDEHAAIHEYMHVVIRHSGLKLPLWLNEGWAEVFSSLRPMGKEMAVGDLLPGRMKTLDKEKWLDFDALVAVDKQSPSYNEASRAGIFYAESWALVHMLFLAPEYKDNFAKFVMALHNGKSAADACQAAFGRSSAQVFADLRTYFGRKNLSGTAFQIGADHQEVPVTAAPVADPDVRLMQAELLVASGKRVEARAEYAKLEQQPPVRPELLRAVGNLALIEKNNEQARQYFRRAFDAGDDDARMCYELSKLEQEAKSEPAKIMPILERALKSRPDFPAAETQLGLLKVDVRDFTGAVAALTSIPSVNAQDAPKVYCGLALSQIEVGDIPDAQANIEKCRQWARSEADIARVKRLVRFIDARAQPSSAVHLGEKLQHVAGVLRGVECSPQANRIVVAVGDKVAQFDLPAEDAIEMPAKPAQNVRFQCGAMSPIRIAVEFAPPRSAMETSAGIVRRLVF
jgi:tetratricopeptide (TPR) repeat protein